MYHCTLCVAVVCRRAFEFRRSGACANWLVTSDDTCKLLAKDVNGPLAEALIKEVSHADSTCFDLFRFGALLFGDLPFTGNGVACSLPAPSSLASLQSKASRRNTKLLKRLGNDRFARELLACTEADARLGRMTQPVLLEDFCPGCPLSLRFGVEQGINAIDGSLKIRPVDDFSASGVNECCRPAERLSTEGIDRLILVCRALAESIGSVPLLWKADIDSAYRRIPIACRHRWAARVVFGCDGHVYTSDHIAMPFGATASVHAWDRIGELLLRIGRSLLFLPLLRYVDDYFSADRQSCAKHAMLCFARLVRCLLGSSAVSERKLCCASPLTLLGLDVSLSNVGARFTVHADKRQKWMKRIQSALDSNLMSCGLASKLAGALSWATSNLFHRLGRALLRPLFAQARGRTQNVNSSLRLCLEWWLEVLASDVCELVPWKLSHQKCVHLFCDARSVPPRIAAVLLIDGQQYFTDCEPPVAAMEFFRPRADNQIMGLELLSIALGLSSFGPMLTGRKVLVFSDNVGSEYNAKKGKAKSWDHSCIVHSIWRRAALSKMMLWIERVPTDSNIADLPSREDYGLLGRMGAKRVEPCLDDAFLHPDAWANLTINGGVL